MRTNGQGTGGGTYSTDVLMVGSWENIQIHGLMNIYGHTDSYTDIQKDKKMYYRRSTERNNC